MGQVPNQVVTPNSPLFGSSLPISLSIGIVGRGKAARHLKFYFESMGYLLKSWDRSQPVSLLEPLTECNLIFLAISDSQVENFVTNHPWLLKTQVVHLSGSLVASIPGLHPLVSFGPTLFELDFYKRIAFVVEKEAAFDFKKYFPNLPNPVHSISREQKAKYHAYCVASNNFTTMLWQKYFDTLQEQFGIPQNSSFSLFDSTFRNIQSNWKRALTGPLTRRDSETIAKNIAGLSGDSLQGVYRAFVEMYGATLRGNVEYVPLEQGEVGP